MDWYLDRCRNISKVDENLLKKFSLLCSLEEMPFDDLILTLNKEDSANPTASVSWLRNIGVIYRKSSSNNLCRVTDFYKSFNCSGETWNLYTLLLLFKIEHENYNSYNSRQTKPIIVLSIYSIFLLDNYPSKPTITASALTRLSLIDSYSDLTNECMEEIYSNYVDYSVSGTDIWLNTLVYSKLYSIYNNCKGILQVNKQEKELFEFIVSNKNKLSIPKNKHEYANFMDSKDYGIVEMIKDNTTEFTNVNTELSRQILGYYNSINNLDVIDNVFVDNSQIDEIVRILNHKKNIVLQGVPGVGKTYIIEHLIKYGFEYNSNNIKIVQFHQSFSYEEFIEGLRPDKDGSYIIEDGVFKSFVKEAFKNRNMPFFMIIDEVNRGNISKIFGELLMLIESDKRDKFYVTLPYSKENFVIPSNLYLVCTMNTADRSLSLVDYALRRRFSFITLEPAFNNFKFKTYMVDELNYTNDEVDKIIMYMNKVNERIENYLDYNFKIGHSYFMVERSQDECFDAFLNRIFKYDIIPTIEEYFFDDTDKIEEFKEDLDLK